MILSQFTVSRGFVVTRGEAGQKPKPNRVYFFTMNNCPPCSQCKTITLPELKRRGWKIGHDNGNDIQTIQAETNPEWVTAYKVEAFPTWVRIEKDCITGSKVGYLSADQMEAWFKP